MITFLGRRRTAGMILMLSLAAASASVSGSATAAAARADGPGDYSHVIPVGVSGNQAVVQLRVPRAVYLEARSSDLRDLRLFDSAGTPMPFSLVERAKDEQETRSTAPVAIFAVRAPAGARQDLLDGVQIRTRDDGAVISVTAPAARGSSDELASLVLDMQAAGRPENGKDTVEVSALVLTLPPGIDSYNGRVALETSDDLQRWEPLTEGSVSWLVNSQGARVHKNRIEFAPRSFRYARIAWLAGKPIEFAAITADYGTRVRAPHQWENLVLQARPSSAGDDLVYAAPIAVPVEAVGLVFHVQNVVLPALLGQYQELPGREAGSKPADLRPVTGATFYQLTQNGQPRASGDVAVPLTHAAQWVLRPQASLSDRPELRLLWQPATLVFVAGGKGPYTLAFGRAGVQPAYVPLAQVAPGFSPPELAALEQAKAGTPVQQHESSGAADQAGGLFHRREFWLWALLLCGVAALAWMAWRLTRQLKDGSSGEAPE